MGSRKAPGFLLCWMFAVETVCSILTSVNITEKSPCHPFTTSFSFLFFCLFFLNTKLKFFMLLSNYKAKRKIPKVGITRSCNWAMEIPYYLHCLFFFPLISEWQVSVLLKASQKFKVVWNIYKTLLFNNAEKQNGTILIAICHKDYFYLGKSILIYIS